MRVRRHTPNFVERAPEPGDDVVVESVRDMLALPYIHSWSEESGFKKWARADCTHNCQLLMALMDDGSHWVVRVVARLEMS